MHSDRAQAKSEWLPPRKFRFASSGSQNADSGWKSFQPNGWRLCPGDRLYLDFDRKHFGRIHLHVATSKSTVLRVYAYPHQDTEAAFEFASKHYKNPEFPLAWGTIILPPIEGLLTPGEQHWADSHSRAFRFLRLEAEGEIVVRGIELEASAWPGLCEGHFECSDSEVNRAWEMGRQTLGLCIQPALESQHPVGGPGQWVLWDGCRRDREIWIGDLRPAALAHYSLSSNPEPVATSLRLAASGAFENGLIPGSVSSRQVFNEYALWWVIALWEYVVYTGDTLLATELAPALKRLMGWIASHVSASNGLFEVENSWSYTLPRKGPLCGPNIVLSHAYLAAARLAKYCDLDAASFELLAADQRARVLHKYYDTEHYLFRDLPDAFLDQRVWEDNNALGILLGVAPPQDRLSILAQLKNRLWGAWGSVTCWPKFAEEELNPLCPWAHNGTIWPFANAYEVGAWMQCGQVTQGLDLLKRYTRACHHAGSETIWEMIYADGSLPLSPDRRYLLSLCHAWGATANHHLHRDLLGVAPLVEGWRKVRIAPNIGNLEWVVGSVPTPMGPIRLEATRHGGAVRYKIVEMPPGIEVESPEGKLERAGR